MRKRNIFGIWLLAAMLTDAGFAFAAEPLTEKSSSESPSSNGPPNVILILTDDQGYGPMGCHGDAHAITPHLDRLHGESVRFTNFHVQPNCAPTRAILMTGRPPLKNGVWATVRGRSLLRRGESTIADSFKASGYRTALFGKWHLGDNYPFRPQDRGFEEVLIHGGGGVGNIQDYWANNYFDDHYLHNGSWKKFEGYCTDIWFEEAMRFIEANREKPWFVMISTNTPHLPNVAPEKYNDLYKDDDALTSRPGSAEFYAMVTNIDDNVGRLRRRLEVLGLEENTLLIFMSDNGSLKRFATWNAGTSGSKGSALDGGHRVPFFLHWPAGSPGGRDVDVLTSGMDLRPTLEELCGLERTPMKDEDGKSLVPLLRGESPEWVNRVVCLDLQKQEQVPRKENPHVVMQGHWRWVNGELHDIKTDPAQQTDLSDTHPERASRMQGAYDRWWRMLSARDTGSGHEIAIGSDQENPTTLTTHDISGDFVWNQDQVLAGVEATGYWEIEVDRDGDYEFALSRYPFEARQPILGTIPVPEGLKALPYFDHKNSYAVTHERSRALPVASVSLTIGAFEEEKTLPQKASALDEYEVNTAGDVFAVKFSARLKAGVTKLTAAFTDEEGNHLTAPYYIKVTRK
ncbi:MAG: arylsulfatase [Verrucomicrobiota bacterium]